MLIMFFCFGRGSVLLIGFLFERGDPCCSLFFLFLEGDPSCSSVFVLVGGSLLLILF